jgi:hypothetical protein
MITRIVANRNLVLQSFFTFAGLSAFQLSTWIPLRYWGAWGGGNFLDTWQILRYGKCYETVGLSVYEGTGTNCSNYLYGRTLLQLLSFLGIDVSLTQAFGYTFLLLLAIGLSWIFPIESKRDCLLFALVVFSPPVMLLADRGNFDILIFFLLILIAKLVARGSISKAYILLSITVLLKYYTAPVFLLLILFSRQTKERVLGAILLMSCVWLSLRDIAITEAQYPHGSDAQFGFSVWGEYLNKYSSTQVNQIQNYLISASVFGLISLILLISTRKNLSKAITLSTTSSWQMPAFWIFFTVSIACYFGGMNFDYRLIYFATVFLLTYKIIDNFYPQVLINALMIILWLSFPSGGLQPLGDLAIETTVAFSLVFIGTQTVRKSKFLNSRNKLS